MKFLGCSHIFSNIYAHISLDPPSTTYICLNEIWLWLFIRFLETPWSCKNCFHSMSDIPRSQMPLVGVHKGACAAQHRGSDPSPAGWTHSRFVISHRSQDLVPHFSFLHPFYTRKVWISRSARRTRNFLLSSGEGRLCLGFGLFYFLKITSRFNHIL